MLKRLSTILLLAGSSLTPAAQQHAGCAQSGHQEQVIQVHGRLALYNGGYPNFRLWQIGTTHLFGIYSNAEDRMCKRGSACFEGENTRMPSDVERRFSRGPFEVRLYGDFTLLPLEPQTPGHMQPACILSAKHLLRVVP